MSINIMMIPFVLAIRAIMGEERFDAFARERERPYPTTLKTEDELADVLSNAGYDMLEYGSVRKTHFGTKNFFWWEMREGTWTAIFDKSDNEKEVQQVLERLKSQNGPHIFPSQTVNHKQEVQLKPQATYSTNFTDKTLLLKTLSDYRLKPVEKDGNITCHAEYGTLVFNKGADEHFNITISESKDISKACFHLDCLDDEYRRNVQEFTYDRIIEQIKGTDNMVLESEHFEEDTIVLTVGLI